MYGKIVRAELALSVNCYWAGLSLPHARIYGYLKISVENGGARLLQGLPENTHRPKQFFLSLSLFRSVTHLPTVALPPPVQRCS